MHRLPSFHMLLYHISQPGPSISQTKVSGLLQSSLCSSDWAVTFGLDLNNGERTIVSLFNCLILKISYCLVVSEEWNFLLKGSCHGWPTFYIWKGSVCWVQRQNFHLDLKWFFPPSQPDTDTVNSYRYWYQILIPKIHTGTSSGIFVIPILIP